MGSIIYINTETRNQINSQDRELSPQEGKPLPHDKQLKVVTFKVNFKRYVHCSLQ